MSLKNTLVDFKDSLEFHSQVNSQVKNYKAFENGYHNLFDDNESEEAKNVILQWCNQRLQNSKNFSIHN